MSDFEASKSPPNALSKMLAGQELCDERCRLWRMTCRLPLRDIRRLNGILERLSDDNLRQVAAFAEDLADFLNPVSSVEDATTAAA